MFSEFDTFDSNFLSEGRIHMSFFKKPGAALLVAGLVLFFLIAPLIGGLPLVGGAVGLIARFAGAFGIVGGGYLVVRSIIGPGGNG